MKTLKLKKEVIANIDNATMRLIGGNEAYSFTVTDNLCNKETVNLRCPELDSHVCPVPISPYCNSNASPCYKDTDGCPMNTFAIACGM